MGFLDKAKAAADQAADRVQQGVGDVQTKRDLTQVYGDLGRTAYSLAQRGEISHAELTPLIQRVSELEGAAAGGAGATPGASAPSTPVEPEPAAPGGATAPAHGSPPAPPPAPEQQMPG